MKKTYLIILCLFSILFTLNVKAVEVPKVTDHEKINIYVFRKEKCPRCIDELTWLNSLKDTYSNYINVVVYEAYENVNNQKFLNDVVKVLDKKVEGYPFTIVADKTFLGFLAPEYDNEKEFSEAILQSAFEAYQDDNYSDIVAEVAKNYDNLNPETLKEACIKEGIIEPDSNPLVDWIIIGGIMILVIGGCAALVIMSRRK